MVVDKQAVDTLVQAGVESSRSRFSLSAGMEEARQNWRVYLMALSAGMGGLAFGWDSGLIGGVLTQPSFQRSFGLEGQARAAALAALQSNIVSVLQAGCFFGAAFGMYAPDRFGRKPTLLAAAVVFLVGSIIQTTCALGGQGTSAALGQLYAGRIVGGFGVGLSSATCATYISECAPRHLRGRVGGCYQLMIVTGLAVAFWINYGIQVNTPNPSNPANKEMWQKAFGLQCLPGVLLFGCMALNPESPRWLLAKGRRSDAEKSLSRLQRLPASDAKVQGIVDEIQADLDATPVRSKRELFHELRHNRIILYRTVGIQVALMTFQQWTGTNSVNYYSPQIFKSLGLSATDTTLAATGYYGIVKIVTTALFLMFAIEQIGRKWALLIGGIGQALCLFFIGAYLKISPPVAGATSPTAAGYVAIVAVYLYVSFYGLGWSGTCWSMSAEVAPNHMRGIAVSVAAMTQWFFNWMIAFTFPRMRIAMDYGVFFLFAVMILIGCAFAVFLLPEPQGIPIEAMHYIFEGNLIKRSLADMSFKKRKAFVAHVLAEYGGTADIAIAGKGAAARDVEEALAGKHRAFEQQHGHGDGITLARNDSDQNSSIDKKDRDVVYGTA